MTSYSNVKRSKFFTAILVLLLSSVTMIMLSGCGGQKYGVSGKVTSGVLPLPGATVTLYPGLVTISPGTTVTISPYSTKITDINGHYSFSNVPSGQYTVSVSFQDYNFFPSSRKLYLQGIDATGFNFSHISQVTIAASFHTVYVKPDGSVLAWGKNSVGQLGDGTTTQSSTPVHVSTASGLPSIRSVAVGDNHTVALGTDGSVWAWGDNTNGQLGNGTSTTDPNPTPIQIIPPPPPQDPSGVTVKAVAAGGNHTIALKSDGTVWAWGDNTYGQLGDGTTNQSTTPVQAKSLSNVVAIAAGHDHTVALKSDNTAWAWGYNKKGQLGDGTTNNNKSPVQVSSLTGVLAIAAGFDHTIAVRNDNTVWDWGNNSDGQLGNGTKTNSSSPVQASNLSTAIAVAAGFDSSVPSHEHSVALKDDGTVWTWGSNSNGQLGNGNTTLSNIPVAIVGLPGITLPSMIAIAAGYDYTVALGNDNTVWTWGSNSNGQLGNGTTDEEHNPIQVQVP